MLRVIAPGIPPSGLLTLSPEESHHLVRVRRAAVGTEVSVMDGRGTCATAVLRSASPKAASLEIREVGTAAPPAFTLHLLQAIPKGKTMDGIVQRATELGVHQIHPLCTEHSEVHLESDRAAGKVSKWQAVAEEAMKQCGNPWRPEIHLPARLDQAIASLPSQAIGLVASLRPPVGTIRAALADLPPSAPTVALAIGPEGDFSGREYDLLAEASWRSVTLGPLVLRAETASCALTAIALAELRELLKS